MKTKTNEKSITPEDENLISPVGPVEQNIYEQFYLEDLDLIKAVPLDALHTTSTPFGKYVGEAETLHSNAKVHFDRLATRGFTTEKLTLLHRRTGATRIAIINFQLETKTVTNEWKAKKTYAFDFRDTLLTDIKFACRERSDLSEILKDITKGASIDDMIHDLFELAKLGESVSDELKAINFDSALLSEAKQLSTELNDVRSISKATSAIHAESRIIKDQAMTLLARSVHEIHEYAQYVFKKEPAIADLFKSQYNKNRYSKAKKAKEEVIDTSEDTSADSAG